MVGTCRDFGLRGTHLTEHPGVWIGPGTDEDRKIASVGVHLRRNVSSHGVGLNVGVDLGWFDRIVACGLVGRRATSVGFERRRMQQGDHGDGILDGRTGQLDKDIPMVEEVADAFASNVATLLPNVEDKVLKVSEADVWPG